MSGIRIELDWWVGCDLPGRSERWRTCRVVTLPAVPREGERVSVPVSIASPAVTSVTWTPTEDIEDGRPAVFVTLEPRVATDSRTLDLFDRLVAEHGWERKYEPVHLLSAETRVALRNYDELVRRRGLDDVELHFDVDTVGYGDGGAVIDILFEPEFPGHRMADDADTRTALKNYDHLLRAYGLDNVVLRWDAGLLGYGENGAPIDNLIEPGFTEASNDGIASPPEG